MPGTVHRPWVWVALASLHCFAAPAGAADAPRSVHGSGDAFSEPGIALAWAVQRGSSEASTEVVIRVATDAVRYPFVAVAGVDPFTQARQTVLAATRSSGSLDVRTPRARFADYPRTELRFYAGAAEAASDRPAVLVYYLGVPDTTPEFADAAKLDAYLAARIAKVRAEASGKPK